MGRFILGLDAGTTGIRAVLYNKAFRPQRSAYTEFRQFFPKPGWIEHDPEEIWTKTRAVLRKAVSGVPAGQIDGLGITNQRETVVIWDSRTQKPLSKAIVWQCRRTTNLCAKLRKEGREKEIRRKTGLYLDPYFSGSKIRWLIQNVSAISRAARQGRARIGTVDSWLIAKLTEGGVHATDFTNASRTLLFHLDRKDWDEDLLRLFHVRREMLPEVRHSSGDFGSTGKKALGFSIPILGVAGDQQAALFGQGCWSAGSSKNTYGTGCFFLVNTGNRRKAVSGLLTTLAADPTGRPCYAIEGSVFVGGAVVQWLRDGLQIIRHSGEVESVAGSVEGNDGVYFVPAFVGLGAPYWDPEARGAILGLTRGSSRAHIARAALESIAFQSHDLFEAIESGGTRIQEVRVDGGACRNDLLMQFQADLFGVPVLRPQNLESTVLGAAALAAVGAGWVKHPRDLEAFQLSRKRFTPKMKPRQRRQRIQEWKAAVRRVMVDSGSRST